MPKNHLNFDWSLLDRNNLISMLWELHPDIADKSLPPEKIHQLLANHLKKHLPVRVAKKIDGKVDFGWVYIGGTYYSDFDQEDKKCLEVVFVYNPFDDKITITKRRFKRMCKTFSDVILHEIIHMRQYRRRDFKALPSYESSAAMLEIRQEQSYLGSTDEIDAYSFNIACELLDKCKNNVDQVISYLGKKHRRGKLKSNCLKDYLKAFEYNHNHTIIKRLKKRTISYLPNAQLGKPYKSKDWISC